MKFTGSEFQYISLRDANCDIFIIVIFAKRKKEKEKNCCLCSPSLQQTDPI